MYFGPNVGQKNFKCGRVNLAYRIINGEQLESCDTNEIRALSETRHLECKQSPIPSDFSPTSIIILAPKIYNEANTYSRPI